jgi:hypothetical protein
MTQKMMLKRLLIALLIGTTILTMPVMADCKITVRSNPDGAMIYFNGVYTNYVTPHVFYPVLVPPAPITEVKLVLTDYYDWSSSEISTDILCPDVCTNPDTPLCQYGYNIPLNRKPVIATPEFPSTLLPVTMIIGFLGAVLLIQRTREH